MNGSFQNTAARASGLNNKALEQRIHHPGGNMHWSHRPGWFKLFSVVALLLMSVTARAQSVEECAALMKYGVYDKFGTLSVESRFRAVQEFFLNNQFSTRQQASSKAGALGLSIEDVLDLKLNGKNSSSNFEAWRSELVKSSFEVAEQQGLRASTTEQISARITELVGKCLTREGTHLYIIPGNDARNFTVTVDYKPFTGKRPETTGQLTIQPASVAASCAPKNLLDVDLKIGPEGKSLSCSRLPSETVSVVANLEDGNRVARYDGVKPPPTTVKCFLEPNSIPHGGTSVLSWEAHNATKVQLGTGGSVPLEEVQAEDKRTVNPQSTTKYRLVATSMQGQPVSTECTLTVQPPPPVLTKAQTHFHTTNDDKDHDTHVSVAIQCGSATIVSGGGTYEKFPDNTDSGWKDLNVIEPRRKDQVVGSCVASLVERPNGHDEWHFDWTVELTFSDGTKHRVGTYCDVDYDRPNCNKQL